MLSSIKINHETPIGHEITEADKKRFIKKKCFYCRTHKVRMTKKDCDKYQALALTENVFHPSKKCFVCKEFKLELKKTEKKTCQLQEEFPGYCFGEGHFFKKPGAKSHEFKGKHYCTGPCGHRHNYFKRMGYKTSSDVIGRVAKSFRPETVCR